VSADISELLAYAHQVEHAITRAEPELEQIGEQGIGNVRRNARRCLRSWSRGKYLKHYPRSFSDEKVGDLEWEAGPDASKKQGKMGRGVEFGSVHTAPSPHWLPAADEEEPKIEKKVDRVVARHLK
jgi:hypothetical protein